MHVPVLLQEVVSLLDPKPGEFFIDGTLGGGGHAGAIIDRIAPKGKFLGIDRDEEAISTSRTKLAEAQKKLSKESFLLTRANFADLPEILTRERLGLANGLLLDLGVSSNQLQYSSAVPSGSSGEVSRPIGRGFSFMRDEPLLMTYDDIAAPVSELLKTLTEKELADIIHEFGEERYAREIARSIKEIGKKQPIETTKQLTEAILKAVPIDYERGRHRHGGINIHPATRTFMALRIYANSELDHLREVLENLPKILGSGGRVAIISFHSLEDRIVKQFFKTHSLKASGEGANGWPAGYGLEVMTKKPIGPGEEEIRDNPRSRSAKLRGARLTTKDPREDQRSGVPASQLRPRSERSA